MRRRDGHAISGAFVFLLLGTFAVFSTVLVLLCAQAYRHTVDTTARHRDERIMASFVRNVLRAEDAQGTVTVEDREGTTVLVIGGMEGYTRYLYCWEGNLCDLLLEEEDDFDPSLGEAVCAASAMTVTEADGLMTVTLTDADGAAQTLLIARRCAE